jgi:uncharacterized coiled-coil protein SlyX
MATDNEEPYSTIFNSLKHPIRRRILRMLSKQPMSFSDMIEALGVSTSFLTYHLDNLGELICKTEDNKYKLSSFGEAANATMDKVEDIPTIAPHNSKMLKTNWFKGRSAVVALGIVCILMIATLGGAIAYYTMTINNKQSELDSANKTIDLLNETIAKQNDAIDQLNTTISNLNSQVSSLYLQISVLKSLFNATPATVSELVNDTSDWVNSTVVLEGNLYGPLIMMGDARVPYDYELSSGGQTIGLTFSSIVNLTVISTLVCGNQPLGTETVNGITRFYLLNGSITARIYGVVKQGEIISAWVPPQVTYYIEAEEVEMA